MISDDFTFNDTEGVLITVHRWLPEEGAPVKAVVQIAHGLAERAQRYARLADKLTRSGYAVYANDHRGHGLTAGTLTGLRISARTALTGWPRRWCS